MEGTKQKVVSVLSFAVVGIGLVTLSLIAVNLGSLNVSPLQLFNGLFVSYDQDVAIVFDLRFPRIIIALVAGAALAVSGLLMQSAMKNPIADPGIIGISSGASLAAVIAVSFFPSLYFMTPLFACAGGVLAFFIVYSLAWDGGSSPLKIILVGVAVNAMFTGLASAFNSFSGGNLSGVATIVSGSITLKTWGDVSTLVPYVAVGVVVAIFLAGRCNLLALEDKKARSLGINVERNRFIIAFVSVVLASCATAIVGIVGFLGLIAPHIGRLLVGSDHKVLVPFSILLGAFILLLADTLGRTIADPYEISAAIMMAIFGGPAFIVLLRKRGKEYAG